MHASRARARYREETIIVKGKMNLLHSKLRTLGVKQISIPDRAPNEITFADRRGITQILCNLPFCIGLV